MSGCDLPTGYLSDALSSLVVRFEIIDELPTGYMSGWLRKTNYQPDLMTGCNLSTEVLTDDFLFMYVRLGKLQEAFDFIEKTDFEPNEFIWSMLIAGCRSHGNMELGFYAAERLLQLKPKDCETYTLLLSMYISVGKWKDVTKLRKMMKDKKLGSLQDWSLISIKDKVYSFKPDDKSNNRSVEMYRLLDDLVERAKSLGYVSERRVDAVDEDGNNEGILSSTIHHSEKLAVAFGLLSTCQGSSIRVIKSISMYISAMTGREIILRDSKRLHQFNDGQCSCGDFGSLL